MAGRADVKRLVLFHHDPLRDDDSLSEIVLQARKVFATTEAAREGTTISTDVGANNVTEQ